MAKIKIVMERTNKWQDVGELDVEVVPRTGELIAFDDADTFKLPMGDYKVIQVKHYHYWRHPELSEISVFIRNTRQ